MKAKDKTPTEIKIAMIQCGSSQAKVARKCDVTAGHVHRVIQGQSTSDRVQKEVAKAIRLPVTEVFPTRYPKQGKGPRVEPQTERVAS